MTTHESSFSNPYARRRTRKGAVVALAASVALFTTGIDACDGDNKEAKADIPSCPSGYDTDRKVLTKTRAIAAFQRAGFRLASNWVLASGAEKKRLGVAMRQLYGTEDGGFSIAGNTDSSKPINFDTYRANDPSEIMCEIEAEDGSKKIVLSPNAIQAMTDLEEVGFGVSLGDSVAKEK